jgi:hypothetical protein
MRKIVFGAVCAAALLVQAPASARDLTAVLSDVQGSVLVGTEEGFREVSGTTNLAAGDRVVVAADSQAVLSYGPGCSFAVPPNSDITIVAQSCSVSTQNGGPFLGPLAPLGWGILGGIIALIVSLA